MSNTIFLALLLALAGPATAHDTPIFSPSSDFQENPELFHSAWYLGFYAFFWSFLFEISLVIVLHFKQNQFYVSEHAALNLMIVIGQSCNTLLLLRRNSFDVQNGFILRELILLGFILLQVVIGSKLNTKLVSPMLVRGIFILRYLHRFVGTLLYLAIKAQIAIYAWFYFDQSHTGYMVIGLVLGLVLITHTVVFFVLRAYDAAATDTKVDFLIRKSPLKAEYGEILRNIENGDLEDVSDDLTINQAFKEIDSESIESGLTARKQIDWVVLEDRVFDITNLRHPKGNYVLRAARFRDITREVHGLKSFRFRNRDINYAKDSKHQHVSRTLRFLNEHCIGELALSSVLMFRNERRPHGNLSETVSNLDYLGDNFEEIHLKRNRRISQWKLRPDFSNSEVDSKGQFLFFEKATEDVLLNLSSYWNMNYGRYFLVKLADGKCFYSYVTLAAVPRYLHQREQWYRMLDLPFLASLGYRQSRDFQHLSEMVAIQDQAKSADSNQFLHNDDDLKDYFLPLFVWKNSRVRPQKMANVRINGPLGFGLGFNHKSTQNILVLVKDEGILPLTDLLEFLSQRSLIELTKQKIPHPIFGKEYLLDFANGMTMYLYWEISHEFRDYAAIFGLSALEVIEGVAQSCAELPESQKPPLLGVFKAATVKTNSRKENGRFLSFQYEAGFDYPSFARFAMRGEEVKVEKLVVSGPQEFLNEALRNSQVPFQQTYIL